MAVWSLVLLIMSTKVLSSQQNLQLDLFFGLPWSYGALGILVKAEIKIIPKTEYVKLKYYPYHDFQKLADEFKRLSLMGEKGPDFIEGIVFSSNDAVLMVGEMTDKYEAKKYNPIGNYYKPIFYTHVRSFLDKKTPSNEDAFEEIIPLRDYYHRHTRGLFWMIDSMLPFGNHWLFRYTLAWMMPLKIGFLKLTQPKIIQQYYETTHIFQGKQFLHFS